jgi:hypothetical protein
MRIRFSGQLIPLTAYVEPPLPPPCRKRWVQAKIAAPIPPLTPPCSRNRAPSMAHRGAHRPAHLPEILRDASHSGLGVGTRFIVRMASALQAGARGACVWDAPGQVTAHACQRTAMCGRPASAPDNPTCPLGLHPTGGFRCCRSPDAPRSMGGLCRHPCPVTSALPGPNLGRGRVQKTAGSHTWRLQASKSSHAGAAPVWRALSA